MAKFIVTGGRELKGEIHPIGNKNSVLKLIPASILFSGNYTLTNVPAISDVEVMCEILAAMGASIDYQKEAGRLTINTDNMNTSEVPSTLAGKVRASVVFYGPLLARFGKVSGVFPGGDKIGSRELTAHFASFTQMGVKFTGDEWGKFSLEGKPQASDIFLYEPSVTATENVILAAAKQEGTTIIRGAACEPHVQEMCLWLQENGVQIDGIGSNVLYIKGKSEIRTDGREHAIWPDVLDVSTIAIAAAITNSEITIKNVRPEDLRTISYFYEQLGFRMQLQGNDLFIAKNQELAVQDANWARIKGVYSQPWYGFPTDLMSSTIALGLFVSGTVLYFEKLFPDRMAFVNYFEAAGANIIVCDQRRIVITGPNKLKPFNYIAPDIRAGMSYLIASLTVDGVSEIAGAEHIERGYPNTPERYNALGAQIERVG